MKGWMWVLTHNPAGITGSTHKNTNNDTLTKTEFIDSDNTNYIE